MPNCPKTGKVGYENRQQALLARKKMRERGKRPRSKKRVFLKTEPYRCRYCLAWHLTSTAGE